MAILAGVCLALGLLWLVLVLGGPLGPLTVDTAASGFIFFGTVWVVANLIVEAKAKRILQRGPG